MRNSVTAIMLVRNEQHILPITVGYLLSVVGVHQVLIADNGSTDLTRKILQLLSKADERCQWLDASGPYPQSEIVSELAREAYLRNASWVIPTDADEYFWFGGRTLENLHLPPEAGAVIMGVRNFVQWSFIDKDHPRALETMLFSVDPVGEMSDGQQLTEQGQIAFVQIKYPQKLMLRPSLMTVIHKGSHDASGIVGEGVWRNDVEILHAPLRARDGVYARMEKAQRVEEVGVQGNQSWHLRRLLRIKDDPVRIDEEWKANSTRFGWIGPSDHKRRLLFDLRLRRIARAQRSFVDRVRAALVER